jgi:hypothetical protein
VNPAGMESLPKPTIQRIERYLTVNPNDPNGHFIFGLLSDELKKYGAAQLEFKQAIESF